MASLAIFQSKYKLQYEAELTTVGKPTWSLTTTPPKLAHFDWPVEAEAIRKLSKKMSQSCHKLIKRFVQVATVRSQVWINSARKMAYSACQKYS